MDYVTTLDAYISVLYKEIRFLKEAGGRRYRVFDGKKLEVTKNGFSYSIECDTELHLADGFPIRIEYQSKKYYGEILAIEGFSVWFTTNLDLGESIETAFISCEPWNLLEALVYRLKECTNGERRGQSHLLVEKGPSLADEYTDEILVGQDTARKHTQSNPITVIWGPPGTGKTYTLSQIAIDYMAQKKRTLIVSHSNVSVDGAINSILNILHTDGNDEIINRGYVLRYGYVREEHLSNHPTAVARNFVLHSHPELVKRKEELDRQLAAYKKGADESINIEELRDKRKKFAQHLHQLECDAVGHAKIVATTASKLAVEKLFYEVSDFDVVIFDEVSMSYVPQIIYASSLAKHHFVCLGDFRQLAPIAQAADTKLLAQDIFSFLNINDGYGHPQYHPWLVMLNQQRRMHPEIARFVNHRIYDDLIDSSLMTTDDKIKNIVASAPFEGHPLVYVNLSGTYNVCGKSTDNSRFNIMSAMISVIIAIEAEKNGGLSAGIITPYSAQARLIRAMLMDYAKNHDTDIACATIHQFQGSEKDVILFDAVESYPASKAGVILRSTENNNDERLINVALTRAKGKLITVANNGFWFNQLYQKKSILMDLLDYQRHEGKEIKDKDLLEYLDSTGKGFVRCYPDAGGLEQYLSDLEKTKEKIVIILPQCVLSDARWEKIVQKKLAQGLEVIIKSIGKKPSSDALKNKTSISEDAIYPLTILDGKVIWYGFPFMKANFQVGKDIIRTRQDFSFRVSGEKTADLLGSFTSAEFVTENGHRQKMSDSDKLKESGLKNYIEATRTCPECGAPLTLVKGRHYHLACTKCRHTEWVTVDMVEAYILKYRRTCPEHGSSIQAKLGKYGVYAHCLCGHSIDLGSL